jgi:UDP-4-amino-4,6-dideoxy-N-acetyl-beta-L-altrosamine transaminase
LKRKLLPYNQPWIDRRELEEVAATLRSGWLTLGPKVERFEDLLAEYTEAKHAVALSSCTAALHLSLVALGIGVGDEVITSPFTFAATANVIIHAGAKPVFIDIEPDTYNINPDKIEEAITKKTKAIIPVHYAGQPCNMKAINRIAKKTGLKVVEDAAHAIGAEYENRKIGTFSDSTCFSFYATKNITTGEGGAVTTNNEELKERLRSLRLHGMSKDAWKRYSSKGNWYYEIKEPGFKENMTDISAALGIHQIKKLDKFINIRREYAKIYNNELSKLEGIVTPYEGTNVKHPYHLYPILLKKHNRTKFIEQMAKNGISCSVHFLALHLQPFYKEKFGFKKGDFPVTEWVSEREVSLPLYPRMTEKDVWDVIDAVRDTLKRYPRRL